MKAYTITAIAAGVLTFAAPAAADSDGGAYCPPGFQRVSTVFDAEAAEVDARGNGDGLACGRPTTCTLCETEYGFYVDNRFPFARKLGEIYL